MELILNKVSKMINLYSRHYLFNNSTAYLKIAVVTLILCEISCFLEKTPPACSLLCNLEILVRGKLFDIRLSGIRHVSSGEVCEVPLGSSRSVLSSEQSENHRVAVSPVAFAEVSTPSKQHRA